MIPQSLQIAQDFIAVRYGRAPAAPFVERCAAWLAARDAEEDAIRASRFRVPEKLDLLDKATLRVENCLSGAKAKT